jgi:hypothetical protein
LTILCDTIPAQAPAKTPSALWYLVVVVVLDDGDPLCPREREREQCHAAVGGEHRRRRILVMGSQVDRSDGSSICKRRQTVHPQASFVDRNRHDRGAQE